MPFALIFIGLMLTIAGVRNTQADLYALIKDDFTGEGNFAYWVLAIIAVGSLGYVKPLKTFANWFLALLFVSLLFANENKSGTGGFFAKLQGALKNGLSKNTVSADSGVSTKSVGGATDNSGIKGNIEALSDPQAILNSVTGSDKSLITSLFH